MLPPAFSRARGVGGQDNLLGLLHHVLHGLLLLLLLLLLHVLNLRGSLHRVGGGVRDLQSIRKM